MKLAQTIYEFIDPNTIHFAGLASTKFNGKTENTKITKFTYIKAYIKLLATHWVISSYILMWDLLRSCDPLFINSLSDNRKLVHVCMKQCCCCYLVTIHRCYSIVNYITSPAESNSLPESEEDVSIQVLFKNGNTHKY